MNTPLSLRLSSAVLAALTAAALTPSIGLSQATNGFNQTAAGTYDYNTSSNWVGGNINGIWDASLKVLGNQTVTFGADTPLTSGLTFNYDLDTTGYNVTLIGTGGARTITLGGDIIVNTVSTTRTITLGSATADQNLNVNLGGVTRAFTVGSGRTLSMVNVISNGGVTASGGTISFSGANTYSGATTVNSGTLTMTGAAGSSANSDTTVNANSGTTTLQFNSNSGSGTTRAKSVTLNGTSAAGSATATLSVAGNSGANSIDTITNALTVDKGFGLVSIAPNASRNARLTAGSLVINAGSTAFFRGTNLGVNTLASQTANSANISFTSAPSLLGGGGTAGTTTVSILPRAYGSTTTGTGNGDGLVTYDSTYGIRLLNTATEYTSSITSGQTQLDNVRLVGATGTSLTNTLNAATTINSLSLIVPTTTSGGAGVTVTGTGSLTLNSGTIFASQTITSGSGLPATSDAMVINLSSLDFNGQEASIIVATTNAQSGASNITNAPLQIDSVISNANGLTKSGLGYLLLGGTAANTYSGATTVNAGTLGLGKTSGVNAIGGNLVVNAGAVYLVNPNQIADTANVTINGGSFSARPSGNTGTSRSETFNNLTMTGGSYSAGSSGNAATSTINGTALLAGGTMSMSNLNNVVVNGAATLSGTTVTISNSGATLYDTGLRFNNGLTINNTTSGTYTPITINGHATNNGGRVILAGDLNFVGNGTNTNTVTIAAPNAVNGGVFMINGTRTFDIGNGSAAVDLTIDAAVTNHLTAPGATTAVGGLTKTGLGTLSLTKTNGYTGNTTVNGGTLLVSGSISSSAATVGNGGTLALSGSGIAGTVTVNSGGSFQLGTAGTAGSVTINSGTFGGVGTVNSLAFTGTSAFGPGNSPGTVTIATGGTFTLSADTISTFQFTDSSFGVGTFDLVTTPGTATGTLAGTLILDFTGSGYTAGSSVTFINLSALTGTFGNVMVTGLADLTALVDYNNITGDVSLTLAAVPEPSTFALLAGAGLLAFTAVRRKPRTAC